MLGPNFGTVEILEIYIFLKIKLEWIDYKIILPIFLL